MDFSSPTFLFLFLPAVTILYYLARPNLRNGILLLASLVFIGWTNLLYLPFYLAVILLNFVLGRAIGHTVETQPERSRRLFNLGIGLNLGLLILLKISAQYGTSLSAVLTQAHILGTPLTFFKTILFPLGFSYICFQCVSYLSDIYNELIDYENELLPFALYITFFPKFISGPITRYRTVAESLHQRQTSTAAVAQGLQRFIFGLAKKVLIADTIAQIIDPAFSLPKPVFSTPLAWILLLGYSIQLYFDISGYTDMAIGLGQIFGISLPENFNAPYLSKSISEFWRRWHISLSNWFRDYVFTPLELRRRNENRFRTQSNLLIVFLLTGLWHGLTPTFAVWGLLHGAALALETTRFGKWLKTTWTPFQHVYTLSIVALSWVFFRSPDLTFALRFIKRLLGAGLEVTSYPFSITKPLPFIEPSVWLAIGAGLLFSFPIIPALRRWWQAMLQKFALPALPFLTLYDLTIILLLIVTISAKVSLSTRPVSIYGAF